MYTSLISRELLLSHLHHPKWIIADCRFSLADSSSGLRAYQQSHIPGALYIHLDQDLSSQPVTDHGRHPLPSERQMRALFSRMGVESGSQVVVYDDLNGAFASRLWWMLRYMGHQAVAVLDGGWQNWLDGGLPTDKLITVNRPSEFKGNPEEGWLVTADEISTAALLVDSRAPARYRGEIEPIDIAAGHIPGAVNYFYQENWSEGKRFLPPGQIREQLLTLLDGTDPADAVFYCGSGVTACVNLLALESAGLGHGRAYIGSWSDWISDPSRPIAVG